MTVGWFGCPAQAESVTALGYRERASAYRSTGSGSWPVNPGSLSLASAPLFAEWGSLYPVWAQPCAVMGSLILIRDSWFPGRFGFRERFEPQACFASQEWSPTYLPIERPPSTLPREIAQKLRSLVSYCDPPARISAPLPAESRLVLHTRKSSAILKESVMF